MPRLRLRLEASISVSGGTQRTCDANYQDTMQRWVTRASTNLHNGTLTRLGYRVGGVGVARANGRKAVTCTVIEYASMSTKLRALRTLVIQGAQTCQEIFSRKNMGGHVIAYGGTYKARASESFFLTRAAPLHKYAPTHPTLSASYAGSCCPFRRVISIVHPETAWLRPPP
jgi:hypothetical protein